MQSMKDSARKELAWESQTSKNVSLIEVTEHFIIDRSLWEKSKMLSDEVLASTRKSRSYQEKEYKNRVKGRRLLFAANIKIETEMEERAK